MRDGGCRVSDDEGAGGGGGDEYEVPCCGFSLGYGH